MSQPNVEVNEQTLFLDIEDRELRMRNQGVALRNIAVAGRGDKDNGKIKSSTAVALIAYMSAIAKEDKATVLKHFVHHCKLDGFDVTVGS